MSLNYRLSPYLSHKIDPSRSHDPWRNVLWPLHLQDVETALIHLRELHGLGSKPWVLAGHSVGSTLAMMLVLSSSTVCSNLYSLVLLAGIFDFRACAQAHPEEEAVYADMWNNALGHDWSVANVCQHISRGQTVPETVRVLLVHSVEDELVELNQSCMLLDALRSRQPDLDATLLKVNGSHTQVESGGIVIPQSLSIVLGDGMATPEVRT